MKQKNMTQPDILSMIMPVEGRLFDLKDSPDDTFRTGLAGAGFVIDPTDHVIRAPITGTIELIYPSRHVLVIRSVSGVDVMIHIGFDQTRFRNEAIDLKVSSGQTVESGVPLASFDKKLLDLPYSRKAILVIFLQKKAIALESEDKTHYLVTIRT